MAKKEIEFSLELTNTIDKIAEKLGMGATAIIPEYTVLEKIRGFVWTGGGIFLCLLGPIFIFLMYPDAIAQADKYYTIGSSNFKTTLYNDYSESVTIAVLIGCFISAGGILMTLCNIERIVAPKAMAISSLLSQLKRS